MTTKADFNAEEWQQVAAEDYDGVNLTDHGQWQTRLTPVGLPDLYGWDCESTLWFRWCFVGQPLKLSEVAA